MPAPVGRRDRVPVLRPLAGFVTLYGLLFLAGAEMYLVAPLLPTIAGHMAVDVSTAAWLVTVYVLVQAVLGPVLGVLYPRLGARHLITGGAVVFSLGNALSAVAGDFSVLLAGRAVSGLGIAMAGPAIWTYVAGAAPDRIRATAVGAGMGSFAVGQVLGVPLGALIADAAGWRWSFALMAAVSLVLVPLLWLRLRGARGDRGQVARWSGLVRVWSDPPLRRALTATFFFHAANLGAYTYLPALLDEQHTLSVAELGWIGLVTGIGMFLGATFGGRLGDLVRALGYKEAWLLPVCSLLVLAMLVMSLTTGHLWWALAGVLVWFAGAGAFDTGQQTLVSRLAVRAPAVALSWNMSLLFVATAFGVWVMGLGPERGTSVLWAGVVLAVASAVATAYNAWRLPSGQGR